MDVIHKHWIGLLAISAAGGLMVALLLSAIVLSNLDRSLQLMLFGIAIIVSIGTLLEFYAYTLNRIVLDTNGLTFYTYWTPFTRQVTSCEWRDIEDVTANQRNIVALTLGYGTLTVQTAGVVPNLSMATTEDVKRWKREINARSRA